jgi:AraC-like DNA-binding protein
MVKLLKEIPVGNNNKQIEINCKYLANVYTFLNMSTELLIKNSVKQIIIIEKALDYMQNNLGCSVDDIVKVCNISRCYLFKIFKEKLGATPIKIKQKFQAERGEKLLTTTNLSIEEIANEVGLESVAHFRNVFYSRFFTSPGKYRKNHKKDANT